MEQWLTEALAREQVNLKRFIDAGVTYVEAKSSARIDMFANISMNDFLVRARVPYYTDPDLLKRVSGAILKDVKKKDNPNYTERYIASDSEAMEDWIDLIDYIESWYKNIGKPFRLHITEPYKIEYL